MGKRRVRSVKRKKQGRRRKKKQVQKKKIARTRKRRQIGGGQTKEAVAEAFGQGVDAVTTPLTSAAGPVGLADWTQTKEREFKKADA
jgi:hypothetical protein